MVDNILGQIFRNCDICERKTMHDQHVNGDGSVKMYRCRRCGKTRPPVERVVKR